MLASLVSCGKKADPIPKKPKKFTDAIKWYEVFFRDPLDLIIQLEWDEIPILQQDFYQIHILIKQNAESNKIILSKESNFIASDISLKTFVNLPFIEISKKWDTRVNPFVKIFFLDSNGNIIFTSRWKKAVITTVTQIPVLQKSIQFHKREDKLEESIALPLENREYEFFFSEIENSSLGIRFYTQIKSKPFYYKFNPLMPIVLGVTTDFYARYYDSFGNEGPISNVIKIPRDN